MAHILAVFLVCLLAEPCAAMRMDLKEKMEPASATPDANCSSFNNLKLRGHNVGLVVEGICTFWPEKWGKFPATDAKEAEALLDSAFKPDGVYDQMKQLIRDRNSSKAFCWRRKVDRPRVHPTGQNCPAKFTNFVFERPKPVRPNRSEDGGWYCVKNCTDICGSYDLVYQQSHMCTCRSKEPEIGFDTAGPHYNWFDIPNGAPAELLGCAMDYQGRCYGECPSASAPLWLESQLHPVCGSLCEGNKSLQCGYGCAKDRAACATVSVDAVGEVIKIMGDLVGFFTGNLEIALVTDAIVSIAEFSVSVLVKVIAKLKHFWDLFWDTEPTIGFVVAMLQLAQELKGYEQKTLTQYYGRFMLLVTDLMSALKTSSHWAVANSIRAVAEVFLKYGVTILIDTYRVMKALTWPTCEG